MAARSAIAPASRGFEIGREHRDWTLPDPNMFISGRHCEVRYEKGGYWLYDVSRNGTFLNGSSQRVRSPYLLADGDRLQIGHYLVSVSIEGGAEVGDSEGASAFAPPPKGADNIWDTGAPAPPPIDRRELMPPQSAASAARTSPSNISKCRRCDRAPRSTNSRRRRRRRQRRKPTRSQRPASRLSLPAQAPQPLPPGPPPSFASARPRLSRAAANPSRRHRTHRRRRRSRSVRRHLPATRRPRAAARAVRPTRSCAASPREPACRPTSSCSATIGRRGRDRRGAAHHGRRAGDPAQGARRRQADGQERQPHHDQRRRQQPAEVRAAPRRGARDHVRAARRLSRRQAQRRRGVPAI